ncbi:succinylglutamate desuccinylase/aspartoacylase family protein [Tropicibacter sp. R16_0]|uniref:succinylglutamate desuccinylase/aspartoacylase family protein n=1 Tax=Tropicibacter sp. R16_0 TaxID=2821102 RepID=UPI001AD9F21B|nr:succinylglutamate desuccinylase/aspartoacylase family protein [Tropicibacter sp. R16_0]MBO9449256.1 succinylglutamate desuccinylase/aspartoacylase family protein [Tropicibacter sp. R16_0]
MANSLITSEVDLGQSGKQAGYLRVPHSTHRSAYGWLPVPITVIRNGDGPTVLMSAGVHGDEYEGEIALSKLARDLEPHDIQGRLIILPAVNAPAVQAGLRVSPIDDGNLNRVFPGDPAGTPTQMIAHYLETVLLPQCDYLVDLHSGGTSLYYPPTLLRGQGHSDDEAAALKQLQEAFDLPFAWVFTGGGGRQSTARTAMGAGNRNGVVSIMAELGGGGAVSRDVLAMTERGLRRILHSLGMLPGYHLDATRGTRETHAQGSVYAHDAGLFEPFKVIGEDVSVGEEVGVIHSVTSITRAPEPVISPYDGFVLCSRALGQVTCGDAVFQIVQDAVSS